MKLFFNKVLIAVFKFSTFKLIFILEKKNEILLKNEISTELLTSKNEQKKFYYILESPFQMAYILSKNRTFFVVLGGEHNNCHVHTKRMRGKKIT